jgi:hypothetical protein
MSPYRVAAAVGIFTGVISLVASVTAVGIAPLTHAAALCLPCIPDQLFNGFGIPGAVFGGAAAAAATTSLLGPGLSAVGGLFGGGVAARQVTGATGIHPFTPTAPTGDDVTTYIPGVSALPDKGDVIYIPSQGASKVKDVYYDPNSYTPDGNPGGVVIETELGTIIVTGKSDAQ